MPHNAFEVPTTLPAGSLHDLFTIFLSTSGIRWHPERGQQHRRIVNHRQPGYPGHCGELPLSQADVGAG